MEAHASVVEKPFSNSETAFHALIATLESPTMAALAHGAVERLLEIEGRELLRTMFEDHLNLRAQAIPTSPVVGSDDKTRTHRRAMACNLDSLFGLVRISEREGYRGPGLEALCPIDAELNLPKTIASHGVCRRVADLASMMSFDMVDQQLRATTGATVGKRQLEEIAKCASRDFDAFYEKAAAKPVDADASLLVGSADGTGICMRPEALREATRRQREQMSDAEAGRWPKPKRAREKQHHGTRMATVSAVYEIAPHVREPEDVLRDLRPFHAVRGTKRPRPQAKRVSASIVKPTAQVISETFDEMARRDPNCAKRWVFLVDGGEHQLDCVEAEVAKREFEITIVLDFIHVAQYVWGAAKALLPADEAEQRDWVSDKLGRILTGDSSTAAAAMRRSATMRGLSANDRKPIDTCADYLLKYGAYLRYDIALGEGLPIATGVIEGACRHLVKDRMAITGARWGLETAEAVLRLRALAKSGDLQDYLDFHEALELQRNHCSRYENTTPTPLVRPGNRVLRLVK